MSVRMFTFTKIIFILFLLYYFYNLLHIVRWPCNKDSILLFLSSLDMSLFFPRLSILYIDDLPLPFPHFLYLSSLNLSSFSLSFSYLSFHCYFSIIAKDLLVSVWIPVEERYVQPAWILRDSSTFLFIQYLMRCYITISYQGAFAAEWEKSTIAPRYKKGWS